ncbi:MAG: DASS family sodium-coupled anion symporter [Negativicutes bacterium]|nr:DASS family sodium-coupled anion symporter [Negativicutes bacterium]
MLIEAKTSPKKTFSHIMEEMRLKWGVPLAILCMLAVWFAPTPADLSLVGKKALVLFAGVFILFLTEAMPLAVTSLAIAPIAVLLGAVKMNDALSGFATGSTMLMLGALIIATAMVKTRVAERITYVILSKIGGSTRNITIGVVMVNICLAFMVPSSTARTAILLPICLGVIDIFKAEGRSNFAVGFLLIMAFTNSTIAAGIMTAAGPNIIVVHLIGLAGGQQISYMQWLIFGFPPAVLMTAITWWYLYRTYKPEFAVVPGGQAYIDDRLQQLGPMTSQEKRALFVFLAVVALWVTGEWTKIDVATACLIGVIMLYLPKFGVLEWADAQKGVSWQVVLVSAGGISLGEILMKTGAAKWLATSIFAALGLHTFSVLMLLVVIIFLVQYMHFFFVSTVAMATAVIPIILAMAVEAKIPPAVLAMPAGMVIAGYPLLMFYNTLPNILVYGTGHLRMDDFPRVGVVICAIACGVYALCAATYWQWLGLY